MCVIAITGCSGYIGQRLLEFLDKDDHVSRIVGLDVKPPATSFNKLDFHHRDIRDSEISSIITRMGVEKIIHLAFIVENIHYATFGGNRSLVQSRKQGPVKTSAFNGRNMLESCIVDIPDSSYYTN